MPASFNPYRQRRPRRAEVLARGKFFLADEHGNYDARPRRVELLLCREYLWVHENFSIPLDSIRATALTRHGGVIVFWDAIEGKETRFDFTKVGFLVFRQKHVARFLASVDEHRVAARASGPADAVTHARDRDEPESPGIHTCEVCQNAECKPYTFFTLKFIGIAPLAYAWKLTPWRFVLCADHARRQLLRTSAYTAVWGSLGFPGFLAVPYYVCKNIWAVRRSGSAETQVEVLCFVSCALLP